MITDPNESYETQASDRQLWIWGELRAKHVELARRRRQALKDGLLLTALLCLHTTLLVVFVVGFRHLIRTLGDYWIGVSLGQWFSMWGLQRWIRRQHWWQVR